MTSLAAEVSQVEMGLAPVADAFSGTVYSDVLSMKNHGRVRFLLVKGVGATGTSTVTVEACDDTTPSNTTAVAFRYRKTVAGSNPGAITAATTAGFTTSAASNEIYEIEVDAEALASTGYAYVRLKAVEVVDSPVLGGILAIMSQPKFAGATATTTTT